MSKARDLANFISTGALTDGSLDIADVDGLQAAIDDAGGGNVAEFTASGTLPNGKPVVLKSDGTVEVVAESSTSVSESIPAGSEVVYNSAATYYNSVSFDPNNSGKFVICYTDNGNSSYGTACVGTVSGTSISFGSGVVFNSGPVYNLSVSFDPNNSGKFVVCYQDNSNSNYGTACVGTISGTSISFGSEAVFNSGQSEYISVSFDPNNSGKFVVCYQDYGGSSYGTACVGTVSGTSISFGSEYVFNSTTTYYISVSFDPNNSGKFVVCYRDGGSANYGIAIVGTISGTSISFGSEAVFNSGSTHYISVSFDPNNSGKFVVCYKDTGNSNYGTACVGTVSGTSISFGSEVVFNSGATYDNSVAFDPNNSGKFVVCYKDQGNSDYGTAIVGTVSGTSVSFGSEVVLNSANTSYTSVAFDPNNAGKFVVCYRDQGNSSYGTAIVGQLATTIVTTNLTTSNYIGFSEAAYTDGQTASVMLKGGISTTQSGLTVGSDYYVQGDGTLDTTADSVSVEAGKAVSATTLLLKGH